MSSLFKKPKLPEKPAEAFTDRLQELEHSTTKHLQKYLVRRWNNFKEVGRFALVWLIVVSLFTIGIVEQTKRLDQAYKTEVPAAGGTYSEGVVGKAENFNPLFVSSEAESTVANLVFGGLLKYDANNNLVGDLAAAWSVDSSGRIYTVRLRADARWHDGTTVRSGDIVYTIDAIQDRSTRSPLTASWRGVKVKAMNETTIRFELPSPFPPFPHSLTLGIVPRHILAETPTFQLRTANFNVQPTVGSGPFKFKEARNFNGRNEVTLTRNSDYYGGQVQPDRFVIYAFEDHDHLAQAFGAHEISAAAGLRTDDLNRLDQKGVERQQAPLMHETFAFFKTSQSILHDVKVRRALSAAVNKPAVIKELNSGYKAMNLPLLPGQLGYEASLDKASFDLQRANRLLDEAGWRKNKKGQREKSGRPMELMLVASSSDEYPKVAAQLQRQWQALGVVVRTNLIRPADFQQNVIIPHNYDILLYELSIGHDPDVFAYWHSSQANEKGLNLAEYQSQTVDEALEGGRSRNNPQLRVAKYRTFLEQWRTDVPAVALYQPNYGYAHRNSVQGFVSRPLAAPVDRFFNITDWTAAQREAVKTH